MIKDKLVIIIMLPLMASILYACANSNSVARVHPEVVKGLPNCTACHTDTWGALNHQAVDFMEKHKYYAGSQMACASCHQISFCADCHARNDDIKPSTKFGDAVERKLPHRGDYMTQHKIDGKINPASCVKCHGKQINEGCKTCHK